MTIKKITDKLLNLDNFITITLIGVSLFNFVSTTIEVIINKKLTFYDSAIVKSLNVTASEHSDKFAIFITNFGGILTSTIIIILLITILLYYRKYKDSLFIIMVTSGGYILFNSLKLIINRERPIVNTSLIEASGYSYPSGHATISTCLYGALIYLTYKYIKNTHVKIIIILILSILILLIRASRVYLGVQYPSYVFAGINLRIYWLRLNIYIYEHINQKQIIKIKKHTEF